METTHAPGPAQAPPHPANALPAAGVAVSATLAPSAKLAPQAPVCAPPVRVQTIPAGVDVTFPIPAPAVASVSAKVAGGGGDGGGGAGGVGGGVGAGVGVGVGAGVGAGAGAGGGAGGAGAGSGGRAKAAVTVCAPPTVIAHDGALPHGAPVHPPNVLPASGVAASVSTAPAENAAAHVPPPVAHVIPLGVTRTAPRPSPTIAIRTS
jgi:hypothetical protein